MDLKEAIYTRRSVREFTAEKLERGTIHQLIDAAIQAPSAVNEQPWSFSVVSDPQLLARMSTQAKAHLLRTPPRGMEPSHLQTVAGDPSVDIFHHAPVLIVISSVTNDQWAVENCSLAAQNLMLAARSARLGTCWIGFAQVWLTTPEGKSALELPASYVPVAPIVVGHPKTIPAAVPRKSPDIHWIGS